MVENSTRTEAAHALAGRLRQCQDDLADRSEKERAENLDDLLKRQTGRMVGDDLAVFLDRLEEYFPAWGELPDDDASQELKKQWNDPVALANQLKKIASEDQNARRREVLVALEKAGLPVLSFGADQVEAVKSLRLLAGLQHGQPQIEFGRVLDVCAAMAQFSVLLDNATRPMWKKICPNNDAFFARTLQETLRGILTAADRDPKRPEWKAELEQQLALARQRLLILVSSIPEFVRRHVEKFAPEEIEAMVEKKMFSGPKLWERYVQLCGGHEAGHLEGELKRMFAEIAGSQMSNGKAQQMPGNRTMARTPVGGF